MQCKVRHYYQYEKAKHYQNSFHQYSFALLGVGLFMVNFPCSSIGIGDLTVYDAKCSSPTHHLVFHFSHYLFFEFQTCDTYSTVTARPVEEIPGRPVYLPTSGASGAFSITFIHVTSLMAKNLFHLIAGNALELHLMEHAAQSLGLQYEWLQM